MTDLNHVVLIGRLTRDIGADERAFAYTPNGTARANISIAVNRGVKRGDQWEDEANFFDVTIWGKTAETLRPYLTKGQQIAVEGNLKQDRWEKDGVKHSRVTIQANSVQLLGGKRDTGGSTGEYSGGGAPKFQPKNTENNYGYSSHNSYDSGDSYGSGNSSSGGFPEDIPF